MKKHQYKITMKWTGNRGSGTSDYLSYLRDHVISGETKSQSIPGSSDPSFKGDKTRYNPEELFVSSLSACHMLWYLHVCSQSQITVTDYSDNAIGIMEESKDNGGHFTEVILHPYVTILEFDKISLARVLHDQANRLCFIANSCNFPISHIPEISCIDHLSNRI